MITPIMYVVLSFVPVGILALVLETLRHFDLQTHSTPGQDRLLRSPGEFSRRKVEQLDNKIWEVTLWILGFPATLIVCYLSNIGTNPLSRPVPNVWFIAFALAFVALAALIWKLAGLIKERDRCRLSFNGERAVGEHLNQLMADGCRVFHEVPLPDHSQINHVVVAPAGIFAIETRTRDKRAASQSQQAHEVVYDGKALEFPFAKDTQELDRVRFLAARLGQLLRENFDAPVPIKPVITFPGCYVIVRGEGDVAVLNPRMIDSVILAPTSPALSPEHIKAIARLLEQKCRDVLF